MFAGTGRPKSPWSIRLVGETSFESPEAKGWKMTEIELQTKVHELERKGWIILVPQEFMKGKKRKTMKPDQYGIVLLRRITDGPILNPHDPSDVARTERAMGIKDGWLARRIGVLIAQGTIAPPQPDQTA